jgi:hypothetical protein
MAIREQIDLNNPPRFMSIPAWCLYSGMSRTGVYRAAARGDIILRKLGTRTLVDVAASLSFLQNLPKAPVSKAE